jgi:hypothetical protein
MKISSSSQPFRVGRLMADVHTITRQYVPPESISVLVEQMDGRSVQQMEGALLEALARVRSGKTLSLMLFESDLQDATFKLFAHARLNKIHVVETLRQQLPGIFDSLESAL